MWAHFQVAFEELCWYYWMCFVVNWPGKNESVHSFWLQISSERSVWFHSGFFLRADSFASANQSEDEIRWNNFLSQIIAKILCKNFTLFTLFTMLSRKFPPKFDGKKISHDDTSSNTLLITALDLEITTILLLILNYSSDAGLTHFTSDRKK